MNYSELERKYGINRKKIKRIYLNDEKKSKTRKRISVFDKHKDIITKKLSVPGVTIAAIHRYLVQNIDEELKYSSLKHYVWRNEMKKELKQSEVMRFE